MSLLSFFIFFPFCLKPDIYFWLCAQYVTLSNTCQCSSVPYADFNWQNAGLVHLFQNCYFNLNEQEDCGYVFTREVIASSFFP